MTGVVICTGCGRDITVEPVFWFTGNPYCVSCYGNISVENEYMNWFKKLFNTRDVERATKKLLRDEPWIKDALRELAQDELLRLHERVVAEINNRAGGPVGSSVTWTSPTDNTIFTIYTQPDKPTIYGGDQ